MVKTKIYKPGWWNAPNAFYVSAMRTTDDRNQATESTNEQWLQATTLFHTTFQALDNAYQKSMMSFSTQTIAEKDEERDVWGRSSSRSRSSGRGCPMRRWPSTEGGSIRCLPTLASAHRRRWWPRTRKSPTSSSDYPPRPRSDWPCRRWG